MEEHIIEMQTLSDKMRSINLRISNLQKLGPSKLRRLGIIDVSLPDNLFGSIGNVNNVLKRANASLKCLNSKCRRRNASFKPSTVIIPKMTKVQPKMDQAIKKPITVNKPVVIVKKPKTVVVKGKTVVDLKSPVIKHTAGLVKIIKKKPKNAMEKVLSKKGKTGMK